MLQSSGGGTVQTPTKVKLVLSLAFAITPAMAFVAQRGPLDALVEKADAVVIGESQSGFQAGTSVALVLSVTRAIKGDVAEGNLLNVTGDVRHSSNGQLTVARRGLWLLKRSGRDWIYLPVFQNCTTLDTGCFVPLATTASSGKLSTVHSPETASDRVALALASSLEHGTSSRMQLYIMARAFSMLGQRSYVTELCQTLRAQSDPEVKLIGLAGLLRSTDVDSALSEIADNMGLLPKLSIAADLITGSICNIDSPDPIVVSSLGRFTSLPLLPFMENCAGEALATIHTRDALPFLARLLDSRNPQSREHAIRGFSRYVDNLPIPEANDQITGKSHIPRGPAPYRTADTDRFSLSRRLLLGESDTDYVQFWKLWWARMQNDLGRESAAKSVN